MIKKSLIIQNQLGIHTRSAAKIVDTAKKFASKIELIFQDRVVDAKSIMGIITLGAKKNHVLEIIIQGSDEEAAFQALKTLFDNKFGED